MRICHALSIDTMKAFLNRMFVLFLARVSPDSSVEKPGCMLNTGLAAAGRLPTVSHDAIAVHHASPRAIHRTERHGKLLTGTARSTLELFEVRISAVPRRVRVCCRSMPIE